MKALMMGAMSAAAIVMAAGSAFADVDHGKIASIDPNKNAITLQDGDTYKLGTPMSVYNYKIGEPVAVQWFTHEEGLRLADRVTSSNASTMQGGAGARS